jgi:hypothetical protein
VFEEGLRGYALSACPKCGARLNSAVKMLPNVKVEKYPKLQVALFECPTCQTQFASPALFTDIPGAMANVKNETARIRAIRGEFMQTLKALRERIQALEKEKADLMGEVEKLRKAAETRTLMLETEVDQMREEAKGLRDLLGPIGEKSAPIQAPQAPTKPNPT